jgi:hypothetical protein
MKVCLNTPIFLCRPNPSFSPPRPTSHLPTAAVTYMWGPHASHPNLVPLPLHFPVTHGVGEELEPPPHGHCLLHRWQPWMCATRTRVASPPPTCARNPSRPPLFKPLHPASLNRRRQGRSPSKSIATRDRWKMEKKEGGARGGGGGGGTGWCPRR